MAGRETRARLLAPSFLVVAAAACGPTHLSAPDEMERGGAHSRGGSAGDGNVKVEPGTGGTGGVVIGGTAGAGGTTGGTHISINPPCTMLQCPQELPAQGSSCDPSGSGQQFTFCALWPAGCDYDLPCGQTRATCEFAQGWKVQGCGAGGEAGAGAGGAFAGDAGAGPALIEAGAGPGAGGAGEG